MQSQKISCRFIQRNGPNLTHNLCTEILLRFILTSLSLVFNTLWVGDMRVIAGHDVSAFNGKVHFVYRVNYVDLLEEEINELIEKQNAERLTVMS